MKVLIACEFSGIVREAFRDRGHDALSLDLRPSEDNSPFHLRYDIIQYLRLKFPWDMMIAFPPCTHLASSGARWFKQKRKEQRDAIEFVKKLWEAPITRIAIENPIGVLSSQFRKPDQIIQPWWFGVTETKATCLWLKNLPNLQATKIIPESERKHSVWREPPSKNRWKNRSRTFKGIAEAMADQWG